MLARWTVPVLAALATAALAGCGSSSNNGGGSAAAGTTSSGQSATSSATSSATATSSSSTPSGSPVNVLFIGDTTGPAKAFGQVQLIGLQGAAAYYNAHGGIAGHKVVITHQSDNSDPTTAAGIVIKALTSGTKPTMIWGGSVGSDIGAMIPIIAKHPVFTLAENDGNNQCLTDASTECPSEWSMADPSIEDMLTLAKWAHDRGYKKIGLLQETDTLSESETPYFIKALNKYGIAHTEATFPATAVDVTPQMQQLKGTHPQAVFMEGLGAPAGYTLVARAKLSWNVPVAFDIAASSLDLTKLVPAADTKNAFEDVFYEQDPKDPSPGIPAMLKYTKPFGTVGPAALDTMSVGWDSLVDLAAAAKVDGGKLDTASLDAAMLKLPAADPLRTFSQRLGYTAGDHENQRASVRDFEIVPAGPVVNGQVHQAGG
jgi:branched-chain amino acid transport system substrate-binding protein